MRDIWLDWVVWDVAKSVVLATRRLAVKSWWRHATWVRKEIVAVPIVATHQDRWSPFGNGFPSLVKLGKTNRRAHIPAQRSQDVACLRQHLSIAWKQQICASRSMLLPWTTVVAVGLRIENRLSDWRLNGICWQDWRRHTNCAVESVDLRRVWTLYWNVIASHISSLGSLTCTCIGYLRWQIVFSNTRGKFQTCSYVLQRQVRTERWIEANSWQLRWVARPSSAATALSCQIVARVIRFQDELNRWWVHVELACFLHTKDACWSYCTIQDLSLRIVRCGAKRIKNGACARSGRVSWLRRLGFTSNTTLVGLLNRT